VILVLISVNIAMTHQPKKAGKADIANYWNNYYIPKRSENGWVDDFSDLGELSVMENITIVNHTAHLSNNTILPSSSIVGIWQCDEPGGSVLVDGSGYNNNGSLSGIDRIDGVYGKGLHFEDGGYVNCGNDESLGDLTNITIETWIEPSNQGWAFQRPITLDQTRDGGPKAGENNAVRIILNTSTFNYSRARIGGQDIRFYDKDRDPVEFFRESWDPYGTSVIWLNITDINGGPLFMYYGNPTAPDLSLQWSGRMIIMSQDDPGNLPDGWDACADLTNRFPRGNHTYGGWGGGTEHHHSLAIETQPASGADNNQMIGGPLEDIQINWPASDHVHLYTGDADPVSILPSYKNITFMETNSIPSLLADGSVVIFNTSQMPDGWSRYSELDERFPRANVLNQETGGTDQHTHYFNLISSLCLNLSTNFVYESGENPLSWPAPEHTHMASGDTEPASNLPPYMNVIYSTADGSSQVPDSMIAIFDELPPLGWRHYNELDGLFPRGNISYGYTSGTEDHYHQIDINTGGPSNNNNTPVIQGGEGTAWHSESTHHHSLIGNCLPALNIPPYFNVTFAQRSAPATAAILGLETPTAVAKPGSYGIGAVRGKAYANLGEAELHAPVDNGWNHLAMSYNSGMFCLYVNGELSASAALEDMHFSNDLDLKFGGKFRGDLDQIAIFDTALPDHQIDRDSMVFRPNGNMASLPKEIPQGKYWTSLFARADLPPGSDITLSLDSETRGMNLWKGQLTQGENILCLKQFNTLDHPALTLTAVMNSSHTLSPSILEWGLNWSKMEPPRRIRNISNQTINEEETRQSFLNFGSYFNNTHYLIGELEFQLWDMFDTENVTLEINGSYLDVIHLEDNWTGNVSVKVNCTDVYGQTSTSNEFIIDVININDVPTSQLLFPGNNDTINSDSVTLLWLLGDIDTPLSDIRADVYLGKNSTPKIHDNGLKLQQLTVEELEDDSVYYWTVIPRDGDVGKCLNGTWKFKVNLSEPGLEVNLTSPPDNRTINTTSVNLTWSLIKGNSDNITYTVWFGKEGDELLNIERTENLYHVIHDLEPNNTYLWKVIPYANGTLGICKSGIWSFSVDASYKDMFNITAWVPDLKYDVDQGSNLTINISFHNRGNVPTNLVLELITNITSHVTMKGELDLPTGSNLTFEVNVNDTASLEPGLYNISIAFSYPGNSSRLDLVLEVKYKDDGIGSNGETDESGSWTLIFITVIVFILILLFIIVLLKQRRDRTRSDNDETEKDPEQSGPREFTLEGGEDVDMDDIEVMITEDGSLNGGPQVVADKNVFMITDIFLIYIDGRLVKHIEGASQLKKGMDKDIMGGMLTAITDFIKDSFTHTSGCLKSLQYGKMNIYIERGVSMYLAVVFQGEESGLREKMRWRLIRTWDKYKDLLKHWDGSESGLAGLDEILSVLLEMNKYTIESKKEVEEKVLGEIEAGYEKPDLGAGTIREAEALQLLNRYKCKICLQHITPGTMPIFCNCGSIFHEECGSKVGHCPNCDTSLRSLILGKEFETSRFNVIEEEDRRSMVEKGRDPGKPDTDQRDDEELFKIDF